MSKQITSRDKFEAEHQKRMAAERDRYLKRVKKEQTLLNKIKLPKLAGFVESTCDETFYYSGNYTVTNRKLENESFKIRFIFKIGGVGTTEYWYEPQGKQGFWATFDRRGIDNSFYWIQHSYSKDKKGRVMTHAELITIFQEHVERVKKQREYAKTAIQVPQIGFSTSPDRKAKDIASLQAGKIVTFYPSGFGVGWQISRKQLYRYSERARPELEMFYGVKPLYLTSLDCD